MRADWERAERAYSARVDVVREDVRRQAEQGQPYEELVREAGVRLLAAVAEVAVAHRMEFDTLLALRELRITVAN